MRRRMSAIDRGETGFGRPLSNAERSGGRTREGARPKRKTPCFIVRNCQGMCDGAQLFTYIIPYIQKLALYFVRFVCAEMHLKEFPMSLLELVFFWAITSCVASPFIGLMLVRRLGERRRRLSGAYALKPAGDRGEGRLAALQRRTTLSAFKVRTMKAAGASARGMRRLISIR